MDLQMYGQNLRQNRKNIPWENKTVSKIIGMQKIEKPLQKNSTGPFSYKKPKYKLKMIKIWDNRKKSEITICLNLFQEKRGNNFLELSHSNFLQGIPIMAKQRKAKMSFGSSIKIRMFWRKNETVNKSKSQHTEG